MPLTYSIVWGFGLMLTSSSLLMPTHKGISTTPPYIRVMIHTGTYGGQNALASFSMPFGSGATAAVSRGVAPPRLEFPNLPVQLL